MTELAHWWQMGGYALYVWLSYGLVAGAMVSMVWYVRSALKQMQARVRLSRKG